MAKIAVALEQALAHRQVEGTPGKTTARRIAQGNEWTVSDIVCTCGPRDPSFEERHSGFSIAIVAAGNFQYRSMSGRELMTPGSLFLGNAGHCFECGHKHGSGDRCISFGYAPEYFEQLAGDAGIKGVELNFGILRLPPLRDLSSSVVQACTGLTESMKVPWQELSIQLAAKAIRISRDLSPSSTAIPGAESRVARSIRTIEHNLETELTLDQLAKEAKLSPYHFLRTFQRLTGLTPHQYVLRSRLRLAAMRLSVSREKILDIALDSGFGDISNFNRAFRTEFGVSPRLYRHSF